MNLDTIKEKLQELAAETDEVKKSAFFQRYLETMSKFWKYSYHNQLLIHFAMPEAARVAGFHAWNQLGRTVKKGSKAIKICAPIIKNEEVIGFRPVNVFDVSQTEGEPLPKVDVVLTGDDQRPLLDRMLAFCASKKIEVEFKDLGVNGLYGYSQGGKIVVNNDNVNTQVNTMAHELAHELLHQESALSKQQKEIQAEGTAYVVCKHFGLEPKSFAYLALYDADAEKIMANLQAIAQATKEILEGISFCSESL